MHLCALEIVLYQKTFFSIGLYLNILAINHLGQESWSLIQFKLNWESFFFSPLHTSFVSCHVLWGPVLKQYVHRNVRSVNYGAEFCLLVVLVVVMEIHIVLFSCSVWLTFQSGQHWPCVTKCSPLFSGLEMSEKE